MRLETLYYSIVMFSSQNQQILRTVFVNYLDPSTVYACI